MLLVCCEQRLGDWLGQLPSVVRMRRAVIVVEGLRDEGADMSSQVPCRVSAYKIPGNFRAETSFGRLR